MMSKKKNEKVEKVIREEVKGFLRFISPAMTTMVHNAVMAYNAYALMYIHDDFSKEKVAELLSELEKVKKELDCAINSVSEILKNWQIICERAMANVE